MTDSIAVSPAVNEEIPHGLPDAMDHLFAQWRAAHPQAPADQFVELARRAAQPQAALFNPSRPLPAALGADTDVWFADFWRTYPRRVGKRDARKAWAAAVRRTGDPAVILRGARHYAADPNLPETQYIPHPATWLNGDRWEDGPLPARQRPTAGRATRTLVGLAQHSSGLPALPAAGR